MLRVGQGSKLTLPDLFCEAERWGVIVQYRRAQSASAWLSLPGLSRQFPLTAILFLILWALVASPSVLAQQRNRLPQPANNRSGVVPRPPLSPELQTRLQALESAKKAGDAVAISSASRSVLAQELREIGNLELILVSPAKAIEAFRRSGNFEDSFAIRTDLAMAYLQEQHLDESLSVITDVLVADPENARAWYVQGKVWLAKKRYDNAVVSFSHVLGLQDDLAASYLLGAAFLQLKEREKGEEAFRRLADRAHGGADVHLLLADAYRAANYMDESAREMRKAASGVKPKRRSSSAMDSVMADAAQFGSSFEMMPPKRQERARIAALRAELRTRLAMAFNDLGTAEAQQQEYSSALGHFHEAAGWDAEVPGLLRNTGIAACRATDYPECIRALRPVIEDNPQDSVARSMLGTALFATHSYADAVRVFSPLGDSVLQLHELAYSWAASLVQINKYSDAAALLNKLEKQEASTDILTLVAQLWSQMGDYQHTVQICHRAVQLNPKLLHLHYTAGMALLRLDRPAEAEQEFRDELQLDGENVDAQFHLAFSLLQQSKNEEAVELFKEVLASQPDHPEANYELGKELRIEGRTAESLSYLEEAVRLKPQFEPAHYQLQAAYRAVGRSNDADREARIYRALKEKSRNITLPAPRPAANPPSD